MRLKISLLCAFALLLPATPALASGEFKLPDGRAWELVTPVNKLGASVALPGEEGGIDEASEAGGALAYDATSPPVSSAEGARPFEVVQNIATRTSSGWQTQDIATPNRTLGGWNAGANTEYRMFTGDLSSAVVSPAGSTPLSASLPAAAGRTIYLRSDFLDENPGEPCAVGCYDPLAPAGDGSEGFRGASPDLRHIVFSSTRPLTDEIASASNEESLYEASDGGLQLVSVLPDGRPASEPGAGEAPKVAYLGGKYGLLVRNAVSNGGSLVVWNALGEQLYLRDMATHQTVLLNAPQGGPGPIQNHPALPEFQGATGAAFGGSGPTRVYFLDQEQLTSDSQAETHHRDLYVAEVVSESPLRVSLTDLTPGKAGEPAEVYANVLGYGEDAAGVTLYYVAGGAFAPGAKPGECTNFSGACSLYFQQYSNAGKAWGAPRFIATMSGGDEADWGSGKRGDLQSQSSRVSPDGGYLTFMSISSLTGYDNRDVSGSGAADTEVFLFDAETDGLRCVSCNPSGARPHGLYDPTNLGDGVGERPLVDPVELFDGKTLGGSVPGWSGDEKAVGVYQPRYLNNEGRVFFDSADGLVPADTNGVEDVYEYEPEGPGCSTETVGASQVLEHRREAETEPGTGSAGEAKGCVGLISSGTSGEESAFVDATESGSDVFFLTSAQLAPQDVDHAYDIYDAHECTAESPCPAGPGAVPPACTDADSCRAAPAAQPEIYGAPSSATFSGPGNTTPQPATAPKPAVKTLTRAQKLATALKACRKLRKKGRRSACEKSARVSYGAQARKSNYRRRSN